MSHDSSKANAPPGTNADTEPRWNRTSAPIALMVLFSLLVYWGMAYLDARGGGFNPKVYQPYASLKDVESRQPPPPDGPDLRRGQAIYGNLCVSCHQANGMGSPGQCPPVAGSDWVAHPSANRLIRIILQGASGPITVSGKGYNFSMSEFKGVLTDQDVVNVLSFIRMNKEWGNNAPPVPLEQVKAIRQKLESRKTPFNPDAELSRLADDQ